tara:strand:+ start:502 stop:735 length:234 start_codon:yes stop_codon:yes gene_type:complete
MDNIVEFPRMKKADEITEQLVTTLVREANKLGLDTKNQDFVYDMAWTMKFIKATVDNQCNISNDLCRLTRAQGLDES